MTNTGMQVGGANGPWLPAVPLRAPLGVRLRCDHRWTPHAFEYQASYGTAVSLSPVDFDCTRCGATKEAGAPPEDGPYRGRLVRLARRIWR